MGMSRLLLTAEASSSPTSRGIDCSLWGLPCRMPCSKFVCATKVIRVELELCKDCRHMSSQLLATSMPTRSPEHKKMTIQDVPASRLSNVDRRGGAITAPGSEPSDPSCSSEACRCPPGPMSHARPHRRRWQTERCLLTGFVNERSSRELTRRGRLFVTAATAAWHGSSS
jgi:hypothetical protein